MEETYHVLFRVSTVLAESAGAVCLSVAMTAVVAGSKEFAYCCL